jgi:hypothetical protein
LFSAGCTAASSSRLADICGGAARINLVCCYNVHNVVKLNTGCLPQLDGFGHSRTEPLLKSMGGFDALFFGRWVEAQTVQQQTVTEKSAHGTAGLHESHSSAFNQFLIEQCACALPRKR